MWDSKLLPSVFPGKSRFILDRVGFRLSQLSIRQLRIDRSSSSDQRGCFSPTWSHTVECNFSADPLTTAFMNRPDGPPYSGRLHDYRGGGFVALLPDDLDAGRSMLAELRRLRWLDSFTLLVVVELDLFYPDVNLFTSVAMATEFQSFGGASTSASVLTATLYRYVGAVGILILLSEILTALLVLALMVLLLLRLHEKRLKFFLNFRNWLDTVTVISMFTAVCFYAMRSVAIAPSLEAAMNGGWPGLRNLMLMNQQFLCCIGISTMCLQVSLLHLIRFSASLGHLLETLRLSANQLARFSAVSAVVFVAFSMLHNLILGSTQSEFSTLTNTMATLFSAMLGKFDVGFISDGGPLAKLAFCVYVSFLMFIMANLSVSCLTNSYQQSRKIHTKDHQSYMIVKYTGQRIREVLFGYEGNHMYNPSEDIEAMESRLIRGFDSVISIARMHNQENRRAFTIDC